MRWHEKPGPMLRNKEFGNINLTRMRVWHANYRGYSYVISWDGTHPDLGFTASWKDLRALSSPAVVIAEFVDTFSAAEKACVAHSKGRRDA